ncbi:polysaccharide lyase 6 family protein [Thalassotalea sp. Y01]|uniref:polysaccharide lyase 6 family protein n=1 Tax=Thalassotalea sp. Y01 TaxID=2729613 RepID=UPI00145F84B0|nr:polysaccharide lyase 6 family protein [Thalassotalea sp. Y01]NMP15113.1 alginate lyase [Thalassotalea sp. Y01]
MKNLALTFISLLVTTELCAKEYLVDSPKAYAEIASSLEAGDTVKLANGTWQDFEILFTGQGTKDQPITLTAETKGEVILSGQSNLRLAGQYLHASGLVFKQGYTPSNEVIAFRRNKTDLAYHSRISEMVIEDYSNPDKQESDYWVGMYGQYNRFDYNYLAGKTNKGVTMAVRLNSENSQQNHHQIDHNYFGPRQILGSNGGETLRIGTSHYSLTDSFTLVENNYFDQCNGEVEIISVKSGKNVLKNNVFFESRGTLTLRHGNGNIIENNAFFGNGVDHTGGIRVINKDQIVRNNYLQGLTGYRFGSGFTIMNGVPNSPINRYHQVENARISNNSFINVDHIQLAAGSDAERSAVPISSSLTNNLIVNESKQPFSLFDDVSGVKFADNVSNQVAPPELAYGITQQAIELEKGDNGLLYPKGLNIGVDKKLTPIKKSQTGPSWYPKPATATAFDSGKKVAVNVAEDALFNAVKNAEDGDVLLLQDGRFDERKIITIDKTITIQAQTRGNAQITFERGTLFEIVDGGSIKIDGVVIDGVNSPDSSGNVMIRSKKWGMTQNYRLLMQNSVIQNLDVNHSFHFFESGKGAFADQISLLGNRFVNVTGDVLRLDKEHEDLGIYNAEYVVLNDNEFNQVQGALVKLYRGGTDESTFGPHFVMNNNTIKDLGLGKRNKADASIFLHGVQVTNIDSNTLQDSAPIVIEHTVGEPISSLSNNELNQQPSIVELRVAGEHTALLDNNKIVQ